MVDIRTALPKDLAGVVAINKVIDYNNPEAFMVETVAANRLFVADLDGAVVGYGMYQLLWGNTPVLSLLKVLPVHQGQGIGSELLKAIEAQVRNSGFDFLLSSHEHSNGLSKQFHAKLGFSAIGNLALPHGQENYLIKEL